MSNEPRNWRQHVAADWVKAMWGTRVLYSLRSRGTRMLKKATAAAQAAGVPIETARRIIEHVYTQPIGNLNQEIGGVGMALLGLSTAANVSADDTEQAEVDRVLAMPEEHFHQRYRTTGRTVLPPAEPL